MKNLKTTTTPWGVIVKQSALILLTTVLIGSTGSAVLEAENTSLLSYSFTLLIMLFLLFFVFVESIYIVGTTEPEYSAKLRDDGVLTALYVAISSLLLFALHGVKIYFQTEEVPIIYFKLIYATAHIVTYIFWFKKAKTKTQADPEIKLESQ